MKFDGVLRHGLVFSILMLFIGLSAGFSQGHPVSELMTATGDPFSSCSAGKYLDPSGECVSDSVGGGTGAYPGDIFINESGDTINGDLKFGGSQTYLKRYSSRLLLSGEEGVILGGNAVDNRVIVPKGPFMIDQGKLKMGGNNIANIGGLDQCASDEVLLGDGSCASLDGASSGQIEGDANQDGVIDVRDALYIFQNTDGSGNCGTGVCEVDDDGDLSISDVQTLYSAITGDESGLQQLNESSKARMFNAGVTTIYNSGEIDGISVRGDYVNSVKVYNLKTTSSMPSCNSDRKGQIRFNGDRHVGCDGSNWEPMY